MPVRRGVAARLVACCLLVSAAGLVLYVGPTPATTPLVVTPVGSDALEELIVDDRDA